MRKTAWKCVKDYLNEKGFFFLYKVTVFFFAQMKKFFLTYHKSSGQRYSTLICVKVWWLGEWTLKLFSIEMLKPHQYFLNSVSLVQHAICMLQSLFLLYIHKYNTDFFFCEFGWVNIINISSMKWSTIQELSISIFFFSDFCVQQQHRSLLFYYTMCTWVTSGNFCCFYFYNYFWYAHL